MQRFEKWIEGISADDSVREAALHSLCIRLAAVQYHMPFAALENWQLKNVEGDDYSVARDSDSTVHQPAVSGDGRILVSGSYNNLLTSWDLTRSARSPFHDFPDFSAKVLGDPEAIDAPHVTVDTDATKFLSPAGNISLSQSDGEVVCVFERDKERHLVRYELKPQHALSAFLNDGRAYVTTDLQSFCEVAQSGTPLSDEAFAVSVFDLRTGTERRTIPCRHPDFVFQYSMNTAVLLDSDGITRDGRCFVFVDHTHVINVISLNTGRLEHLRGHSSYVDSLISTSDGRFIISSSADQTIRCWDLHDSTCTVQPIGDLQGVTRIDHDNTLYTTGKTTLKMRNFPVIEPLVTPVRMVPHEPTRDTNDVDVNSSTNPSNDDGVTAECPCCSDSFVVKTEFVEAISSIHTEHSISSSDSPCLALPKTAWQSPSLRSRCPHCDKPIRFQPYVVSD